MSIDTVDLEVQVQPNGYWVFLEGGLPADSDERVRVHPAAERTEMGGPHREER